MIVSIDRFTAVRMYDKVKKHWKQTLEALKTQLEQPQNISEFEQKQLERQIRYTLMQTIARANRVFGNKVNGLIVDYIGVFRDLQKALAIYGSASGGGIEEGDTPVKAKSALVEQLKAAISEVTEFCTSRGINFLALENTQDVFQRTRLWDEAVEAILINEDSKRTYFSLVGYVTRLYKAILPDPAANVFFSTQFLLD